MSKVQNAFQVGGTPLAIQQVVDVAYTTSLSVGVAASVPSRLEEIRSYVEDKVKVAVTGTPSEPAKAADPIKRTAIYGVTTGFGALKNAFLPTLEAAVQLQENIVLSHSAGTGKSFSDEVVRAVMFLRAHTLARGYSGVRVKLLEHLVAMLNCNVLPVIPKQGSVGCSGDLAPLAHLALGLIGRGKVRFAGKEYENIKTLKADGSAPPGIRALDDEFGLSYKEGLALVNGITVTTALAALNFHRASRLLLWADVIGSMTAEATLGSPRAFDSIVFDLIYGHKGAAISAANVRKMTSGSTLMNASEDVHDPYSVRCIPQVHGAIRDTLQFVETAVENHLNTIDDDPVFFSKEEVEQGGNQPVDGWLDRLHFEDGHFHGAPVGYAMDFLAITLTDLSSISERRIAMLVDKNHNRGGGDEVPLFLTYNPDSTTSGAMIAQYAAASLVSENKVLAHPASVDSIPTSANHEDHVSMSTIAARKAGAILNNLETVLATELLCASLALAFRVRDLPSAAPKTQNWKMGMGTVVIYSAVKEKLHNFSSFDRRDCVIYQQIEKVKELLRTAPPANLDLRT
jgi:histidine ammonia-lyase